MTKAPDEISTPRLVLSRPASTDADAIFERYAGDPEVTRFLSWPRHQSVDDTRGFLSFSEGHWHWWPAGPYLIRSRDDRRLLGSTGLAFDTADVAATGYVLARDAWGRGIATEALTAMVELAPKVGIRRLYALCHPDHRASQHVLEKCGFVRDRTWSRQFVFPNLAAGAAHDVFCYERVFSLAARASAALEEGS
jgi:ribosomal-protein-alanine N-acetyltransferase